MTEKQKEIIKKLNGFAYIKGAREVFCDSLEYLALKIALLSDIYNIEPRKQKQKELLNRYSGNALPKFLEICADIEKMLIGMIDWFSDYLGEIYMEFSTKNNNGQFFTPINIAKMMAMINISEIDLSKPIITINEPCCGSGVLVLAMLEELANNKVNYANKVLVVTNDIDKNCVNMCYLQLAFAGAVAVVKQQNTITQEVIGEVFITPAFALQYSKFKEIYKGLYEL